MKPAFTLKLNGEKFHNSTVPPAVQRAKAYLDNLPDGEMYTAPELVRKNSQLAERTLVRLVQFHSENTALYKCRRVFGNLKTMTFYRKQVGK